MEVMRVIDVCEAVGCSQPTLYRWLKRDLFPQPREIGMRPGWLREDFDRWLLTRPVRRPGGREGTVSVKR